MRFLVSNREDRAALLPTPFSAAGQSRRVGVEEDSGFLRLFRDRAKIYRQSICLCWVRPESCNAEDLSVGRILTVVLPLQRCQRIGRALVQQCGRSKATHEICSRSANNALRSALKTRLSSRTGDRNSIENDDDIRIGGSVSSIVSTPPSHERRT